MTSPGRPGVSSPRIHDRLLLPVTSGYFDVFSAPELKPRLSGSVSVLFFFVSKWEVFIIKLNTYKSFYIKQNAKLTIPYFLIHSLSLHSTNCTYFIYVLHSFGWSSWCMNSQLSPAECGRLTLATRYFSGNEIWIDSKSKQVSLALRCVAPSETRFLWSFTLAHWPAVVGHPAFNRLSCTRYNVARKTDKKISCTVCLDSRMLHKHQALR